jgi:hypothetical protein
MRGAAWPGCGCDRAPHVDGSLLHHDRNRGRRVEAHRGSYQRARGPSSGFTLMAFKVAKLIEFTPVHVHCRRAGWRHSSQYSDPAQPVVDVGVARHLFAGCVPCLASEASTLMRPGTALRLWIRRVRRFRCPPRVRVPPLKQVGNQEPWTTSSLHRERRATLAGSLGHLGEVLWPDSMHQPSR